LVIASRKCDEVHIELPLQLAQDVVRSAGDAAVGRVGQALGQKQNAFAHVL
jgi:hypothetical protein